MENTGRFKPNQKEIKMFPQRLFVSAMAVVLLASACGPSAQSNPADRFAGTWTGIMARTSDPTVSAPAVVTIPSGCAINGICGNSLNEADGCKWEITLLSVNGVVFEYTYSNLLAGAAQCQAGVSSSGTLTLQADGTILREHRFSDFSIGGTLAQIKDNVFQTNDRAAQQARRKTLEWFNTYVFPMNDRAARLARLDALAKIKDDTLYSNDRDARLRRLDELARIKDGSTP